MVLPLKLDKQKINEDRVNELLDMLGLSNRKKHFPNQLSGGQQQRVAVARAIIKPSKIVLADEPTGSLDIKNRNEIFKLLVKLNNRKLQFQIEHF